MSYSSREWIDALVEVVIVKLTDAERLSREDNLDDLIIDGYAFEGIRAIGGQDDYYGSQVEHEMEMAYTLRDLMCDDQFYEGGAGRAMIAALEADQGGPGEVKRDKVYRVLSLWAARSETSYSPEYGEEWDSALWMEGVIPRRAAMDCLLTGVLAARDAAEEDE